MKVKKRVRCFAILLAFIMALELVPMVVAVEYGEEIVVTLGVPIEFKGVFYDALTGNVTGIDTVVPEMTVEIQETVNGHSVTAIEDYAFWGSDTLTALKIPSSVVSIGSCAFEDCDSLTDIYFQGTRAQWNAIYIDPEGNDPLQNPSLKVHCSDDKAEPIYAITFAQNFYGDDDDAKPEINYRGRAYLIFGVKDENGDAKPNVKFHYVAAYPGNSSMPGTCTTDKNGFMSVETPVLTQSATFHIKFASDDGVTVQNSEHSISVHVKKLSYVQEWDGALKVGASVGLILGGKFKIGPVEAKAEWAEAHAAGTVGGNFVVEDAYDDTKRTFTIKSGLDTHLELNGEAGPKIDANIKNVTGLEITPIGIEGAGGIDPQIMNGIKVPDYDPYGEPSHIFIAPTFMLLKIREQTQSALLKRILDGLSLDSNIAGWESYSTTAALSGGIDVLGVEYELDGLNLSANAAGANGSFIWTWENAADYVDREWSVSKTFQSSGGFGLISGEMGLTVPDASSPSTSPSGTKSTDDSDVTADGILGSYALGKSFSNHKAISAVYDLDKGKIKSIGYTTFKGNETNFLFGSFATDVYSDTLYAGKEGNIASTLISGNSDLKKFSKGEKSFINTQKAIDYMSNSGYDASVQETTKKKEAFDVYLEVGLGAGVAGSLGAGIAGEHSNSYVSKTSFRHGGTDYVTSTTDESIIRSIESDAKSLSSLVWEPVDALLKNVGELIESVIGKVWDGIQNGAAHVKGKVKEWTGKISSVFTGDLQSYAVLLAPDDNSSASAGVSVTIGDPYLVEIYTDETQTELVSDEQLQENPVTLTLEYTASQLLNVGAGTDADVWIARNDPEKGVYVLEKTSVQDKEAHTVTAQITKNAEYILVVDSAAPIVFGFSQYDYTETPTVYAYVSDMTDVKGVRFRVDDGADLVTANTFEDYFDKSIGRFVYQFKSPLSAGKHTAFFDTEDALGNVSRESMSFTFDVRPVEGRIIAVNVPDTSVEAGKSFEVSVECSQPNNFEAVSLQCEDNSNTLILLPLTMENGIWTGNIQAPSDKHSMMLTAIAQNKWGVSVQSERTEVQISNVRSANKVAIQNVEYTGNTAYITVQALEAERISGQIYVGSYHNGQQLFIGATDIALSANEQKTTTVNLENSDLATEIRVFLLSADNKYTPMCKSYILTVE